jgi:hypothetical protein
MHRQKLVQSILGAGYVFVDGAIVREAIETHAPLSDWHEFQASWDDLELDNYLADRGRFRRRRYGVYEVTCGGPPVRKPHEPHRQSLEYNRLFGGVDRWFEPVALRIGEGSSMAAILRFCQSIFGAAAPSVQRWHVEVHQFRIEARSDEAGQPTPEGVHRDGVDFVLVLLIARLNIVSGTTTVHDMEGRQLGSFTLTDPFDAALLDDTRVAHGVTPVMPLDPSQPAHRDVLVVTFRRL